MPTADLQAAAKPVSPAQPGERSRLGSPAAPSEPYEGSILTSLLLLFIGSGAAALIYEVVWMQMLQLVIGATGISLGVLLGTFMGGMCLGSFMLPRLVGPHRHPLRVYAGLELGIGLCGLVLLVAIPLVGRVYSGAVGYGLGSILLRGAVCALLLLPPTLLMGATLPAIARWIDTTPRGVSWLGLFYAGNIAGAVLGALLAGFYLLRVYDVWVATFAAVAVNLAVAALSLGLSRRAAHSGSALQDRRPGSGIGGDVGGGGGVVVGARARSALRPDRIHIAIAFSGLTALGAQVVWNRLLSLLLGATVYTFAIVLAVLLAGLGLGSGSGSLLARFVRRPALALGLCQLLLGFSILWASLIIGHSLPFWPLLPQLVRSPWLLFQVDLLRVAWAVVPAAICWGAAFPLAVAAAARPGEDPGRLVGGVYAANTLGAIAGALGFGILVVPWLGTAGAQRLLIALALGSAALLLLPPTWPALSTALGLRRVAGRRPSLTVAAGVVGLLLLGLLGVRAVPPLPDAVVAYGRYVLAYPPPNTLYVGEGMNATIAVTSPTDGVRNFHVSGKVEASTDLYDMRLQRMLGHLSALLHEGPRSVLVVGFGAGVTAGAFLKHPTVERIVICEIEPLIPRVVAGYFSDVNYDVLHDPRVEVVYDDARHYMLTTRDKFDVITSDPIHPWVKGAAALYTQEYFETVRRRLQPGGVVTQWVPLYEQHEDVARSELATFFGVFPNASVWSNDVNGEGYDVVLVGRTDPSPIDLDLLDDRIGRQDHTEVRQSLIDVGFVSTLDLLSSFAGYAPELAEWLRGAQINRDRNLRLMYTAGLDVNISQEVATHARLMEHLRLPRRLFTGSPENLETLGRLIQRHPVAP